MDSGFRRKDCISAIVTVALPPNSGMTHGVGQGVGPGAYGPNLVILPAWDIAKSMTLVAGMLPMEP